LGPVAAADVPPKFYPSQIVTPVAIPAKSTVSAILNVTEAYQVKRALAHITISSQDPLNPIHTRDLEGRLVAPDGTTVLLFADAPRTGDDTLGFSTTTFDDAAVSPVQEGGSGFSGSFNPVQPLAQLIDHGWMVAWKLVITNIGNTLGQVDSFALTFDKPVLGTGLGEEIADRTMVSLRISQTDPTSAVAKGNWTPVGPAPQIYDFGTDST